MDQSKIDLFIASNGSKFPSNRLGLINAQLEKIEDRKYLSTQSQDYKNPATMLIVSFFLGGLGVDRFMLGQTGLGLVKLLTLGGLWIWWFIDLFLIMGATKERNFKLFAQTAH
jgi:TM2 domain-containing membrane protein YozV